MSRIDVIRETALRLFIKKGYGTTSIRDIAAEVGINSATLYHYFPSKYDILIDIVSTSWSNIFDEIAERLSIPHDNWTHRLHTFVDFHAEHHCNNGSQVQITSEAIRHFHPSARIIFRDRRDKYEHILREILEEGTATGEFQVKDVKVTATAILQMLTGIANWYRPSGRLTPRQISELYWDLVCGMVRTRNEPKTQARRASRVFKRLPKQAIVS
ncbi:MAG: TetR/AcrR family transcriptional regulator [Thermomicrobiales bacterium]